MSDFVEHAGWKANPDKTVGITWDGECVKCGFRLTNVKFDSGKGLGISGAGRRIAVCGSSFTLKGEVFTGKNTYLCCSVCVPSIL